MRQLDRPDLRGFVPRQKPSEFRLVLKLTRPENHSLERRKAFLPGGWIFLSTRGRILISANGLFSWTGELLVLGCLLTLAAAGRSSVLR